MSAYTDGIRAGRAGEPESLNPYPISCPWFRDWREGWRDGVADRARQASPNTSDAHFEAVLSRAIGAGERPAWGL